MINEKILKKSFEFGNTYATFTKTIADDLNTRSELENDAIRCVGNYNVDKKIAWPRMHNKFLIFCKLIRNKKDESDILEPYAVCRAVSFAAQLQMVTSTSILLRSSLLFASQKVVNLHRMDW